MGQAKAGDKVKVHYKGTLEDGSVFDTSEGHDPLEFEVGSGQVIVGFDEAVTGMEIGEKKKVLIPVEKAYGPYQNELVMTVPIEQVPPDLQLEVGLRLEVGGPGGEIMQVIVAEVNDDNVILDANPPLAGNDLNFELELVSIG